MLDFIQLHPGIPEEKKRDKKRILNKPEHSSQMWTQTEYMGYKSHVIFRTKNATTYLRHIPVNFFVEIPLLATQTIRVFSPLRHNLQIVSKCDGHH